MSDISPRRRLLGRGALASAFLAVPLTASICYAEGTPTLLAATAQAAETSVEEWTEADVQEVREERIETEIEVERELAEAEREVAEAEREVAEVRREIVEIERELAEGDERRVEKRRIRINGKDWEKMVILEGVHPNAVASSRASRLLIDYFHEKGLLTDGLDK